MIPIVFRPKISASLTSEFHLVVEEGGAVVGIGAAHQVREALEDPRLVHRHRRREGLRRRLSLWLWDELFVVEALEVSFH